MTDLPENVMVMGRVYSVTVKPMKKHDALCYRGEGRIVINENLPDDKAYWALIHEVMHAILHESGLRYIINDDNLEEAIVRAIENGLMSSDVVCPT